MIRVKVLKERLAAGTISSAEYNEVMEKLREVREWRKRFC